MSILKSIKKTVRGAIHEYTGRRGSHSSHSPEDEYEMEWAHEIQEILGRAGYTCDLACAERLVREGYGPGEIEHRVRMDNIENLGVKKLPRHKHKGRGASPTKYKMVTHLVGGVRGPGTWRTERESVNPRVASGETVLNDARYDQRFKFPKWNVQPSVLMEPRLMPRVFPEMTRTQHAARARVFRAAAPHEEVAWTKLVDQSLKRYGNGDGVLISGVYRGHFPELVKEKLRYHAYAKTLLQDAAHAHETAAHMRSIAPSPRTRRLRKHQKERAQLYYYSLRIPYVAHGATHWHPTESTGPFKVLSRGAFSTRKEARAWAEAHLAGKPYSIAKHERGLDTLESSAGARLFRRMGAADKAEVLAHGLKVGR